MQLIRRRAFLTPNQSNSRHIGTSPIKLMVNSNPCSPNGSLPVQKASASNVDQAQASLISEPSVPRATKGRRSSFFSKRHNLSVDKRTSMSQGSFFDATADASSIFSGMASLEP